MARLEIESPQNLQQDETSLRRGRPFGRPGARIDPARVKLARESTIGDFQSLLPDEQIITWRRLIQGDEEPPTYEQLGEQEFRRGPKSKLTRSRVQQKAEKAITKLERSQRGEPEAKRGTISRSREELGIKRNPRGRPRLEMDSNTRELLLQSRHLSADAHRKMVGHKYSIVVRWRGELGIGRNPVGRPRKSKHSS